MRRLIQENEDLKDRLSKAESGTGEQKFVAEQPAAAAPAAAAPAEPEQKPVVEEPKQETKAEPADESESSNSLLILARRLHDEHVREGAEKRDQLIAEGHATAARVVAEAEAKQREELAKLETAKSGLEKKIDELRQFESEYRQNLRSYIEGQLNELDKSGPASSSSQLTESANH
ncbi:DivIVA domain-containing protein [Paramicrobacterium humi]|uniref:DivIVA domain-containing protein n=1 Tax=Paramicrobacterium humi TaxID=640635 RepID=UPI003D9C7C0F